MNAAHLPATAAQKRRVRHLTGSCGRTVPGVLAVAQQRGLGGGTLATLTNLDAMWITAALLALPGTDRLAALRDVLAEAVGMTLQSAADGDADEATAALVDHLWAQYDLATGAP